MPVPNIAGQVMTVTGAMDPGDLGVTLMHEHIFSDFAKLSSPNYDPTANSSRGGEQLTLETLHLAREGKISAGLMTEEDVAIAEVLEYRTWGGNTIVDVTPIGLMRDTVTLRRISYVTGVHVIMGAAYFARVFPENIERLSVEELTDSIIEDVTVGIDGSGIRAGIIGEVGIEGDPISPSEVKIIKAAARASKATGAAISFHRGGVDREKLDVLRTVAEEGGDLSRVVMGHADFIAGDVPLLKEIFELGVYIEFDFLGNIGVPLAWQPGQEKVRPFSPADSAMVARTVLELVEAGYEDRILLSHDVGGKLRLKRYGGMGYSFLLEKFLPHLRVGGVQEGQIHKFMVENPRKVLTFVAPS
ncbi:MAG: aryldialkylphosphatase [Chloroflexi bacterium]|nr:aryldialkylphosphatase [Chloroflexota bacterium]